MRVYVIEKHGNRYAVTLENEEAACSPQRRASGCDSEHIARSKSGNLHASRTASSVEREARITHRP